MSEIERLLGRDALQEITRGAGDVSEREVSDVLEALLPLLQESRDSGAAVQRAAELQRNGGERGLDVTSLLPLLLGGGNGGLLSSLAQSTGVSDNRIQSILKVAAPLLLLYLLNSNQSQPQSAQPAQSASQSAASPLGGLLGTLLGGGQQPQSTPQSQSGGGDLLNAFVSLLADNDSGREAPQEAAPAKKSGGKSAAGSREAKAAPKAAAKTAGKTAPKAAAKKAPAKKSAAAKGKAAAKKEK